MSIYLKPNAVNEVPKGTVLFKRNEKTTYICLVAKGKVLAEMDGIQVEINAGQMMCVFDAYFSQSNLCDYTVAEDSVLYAVPASSEENVLTFLAANPGYRGTIFGSLCKQLGSFYETYKELSLFAMNQYEFLFSHFTQLARRGEKEHLPEEFLDHKAENEVAIEADEEELEFYTECGNLSFEVQGKFFSASETMIDYQVKRAANLIRTLIYGCESVKDYISEMYQCFYNAEGTGLYQQEVDFAAAMKKAGSSSAMDIKAVNETKERLLRAFAPINTKYHFGLDIDPAEINAGLSKVLVDSTNAAEEAAEAEKEADISLLDDSLKTILLYSGVGTEAREEFTKSIDQFVELKDKLSTDDEVRKLRKAIAGRYYDIFGKCAFKLLRDDKAPIAVQLFVDFGFVDERLLTREQLSFLLKIKKKPAENPIRVFTVSEWLLAVYEGTKQPSRNEFEQNYQEFLRDQKKNGYITEQQEKEFDKDQKRKFDFEVENMIRYNSKVVNGKISSYVPILYKEQFFGDIDKSFVRKETLVEQLRALEDKDYSIFYHHVLYSKPEKKIEKEFIEKKVYPDIILMPIYGASASMWQEIETRKRDTPGRFIFPIFCEESTDELMVKMFGRYHWEFVRCEMGASWNNIQYHSLTSEYSDYIQYYRKNRALTEEKREKIKLQITRAKNNLREIFLQDYIDWIKYESNGSMKLNKVAREILATYCPMNKDYRKVMDKNAAMTEAMAKYRRELGKTIKDYELHMRALAKNNIELPKEMEATYQYYLDQQEEA